MNKLLLISVCVGVLLLVGGVLVYALQEEYSKFIYYDLKEGRIVPLDYDCKERPGIIHPTIEGKSLQEIHLQMIKEIEEVCG